PGVGTSDRLYLYAFIPPVFDHHVRLSTEYRCSRIRSRRVRHSGFRRDENRQILPITRAVDRNSGARSELYREVLSGVDIGRAVANPSGCASFNRGGNHVVDEVDDLIGVVIAIGYGRGGAPTSRAAVASTPVAVRSAFFCILRSLSSYPLVGLHLGMSGPAWTITVT